MNAGAVGDELAVAVSIRTECPVPERAFRMSAFVIPDARTLRPVSKRHRCSSVMTYCLTVKLRGRPEAPDWSRGCTLPSRTRGDTTDSHGPLQRLLDGMPALSENPGRQR